MDSIKRLLLENKAWSQAKIDLDPSYFKKMAIDQNPEYLWIGCADSRVPPSEITNTDPGQMFVHRNIANLVANNDMNVLSVISYAVEHLKVPHIIICGHYNCGGIKAAMSNQHLGLLNNWIKNIKDVYTLHRNEVDAFDNPTERVNKLVEVNVKAQVDNLKHNAVIQRAWKNNQRLFLHGWVYDLNTGLLKQISTEGPDTQVRDEYTYDF